jgi:hypothetical protein
MLPKETTIVSVPGHQWGHSPEVQGNNLVHEVVKEAALHSEVPMFHLTPVLQTLSLTPVFIP